MLSALLPLARWLHVVGLSLAVGSAIAVTLVRRSASISGAPARAVLERAAAEVLAKAELPGIGIAIVAGILLVALNPAAVDPQSGQSTWLFVKLPLVMVLAVVAFTNAIDSARLVREREQGAGDDELAPLARRGAMLDLASIALSLAILFTAIFRFALFA